MLLNNRYFLKTCLRPASAERPDCLYQAYDRQSGDGLACIVQFFPAAIIKHCLPNQWAAEVSQVQTSLAEKAVPLMPVTDCIWDKQGSYFIMHAPDRWSFSALPSVNPEQWSSLHKTAQQLSQQWLTPTAQTSLQERHFIVTSEGELYLLGTAFFPSLKAYFANNNVMNEKQIMNNTEILKGASEAIDMGVSQGVNKDGDNGKDTSATTLQAPQKIPAAITQQERGGRFPVFYMLPLMLAGSVLAGGYSFYYVQNQMTSAQPLQVKQGETLLPGASLAVLQDKPFRTAVMIQEPVLVEPESVHELVSRPELSSQLMDSVTETASDTIINTVMPPKPAPVVRTNRAPESWLGGKTSEQLTELISNAMKRGNWQSALYYTRALSRQEPGSEDALQCARLIVETFHKKVDQFLNKGETGAARHALQASKMALKDFDLPKLYEEHQQLAQQLPQ